jgi:hypothetical protein
MLEPSTSMTHAFFQSDKPGHYYLSE